MRVLVTVDGPEGRTSAYADTEAGAALDATPEGADVRVWRAVAWTPEDHATAPLFLVRRAPEPPALDPAPARRVRCARCGLPRRREPPAGGYRVLADTFAAFDLVRAHQEWLVSPRLGERLRERRGVTLHALRGAHGHLLRPERALGWPVDGTPWEAPCDVCGQRRGARPPGAITGLHAYALDDWQGDDVVGLGPMPHALVVSRAVRRLLAEPGWRVGTLAFEPVTLVRA